MTTIYIINGKPRAGKNTFVSFMRQALSLHGHASEEFSSIQPIKDMLSKVGIYLENKTSQDRHLLSMVGDAVEQHCEFRTHKCMVFARSCLTQNKHGFIHIREPENVEKLRQRLLDDGFQVHRIMVVADRSENHDNTSDTICSNMPYDYLIQNEGSLGELFDRAFVLVHKLYHGEQVKRERHLSV